MNKRFGTLIAAMLALLAMPFMLAAQEQAQEEAAKHRHYTLVDIGTFGGPNSAVNFASVVINPEGTVIGGADTSIFDPNCGCNVSHAFKWQNGVLTNLGTLPSGANSFAISINTPGIIAGISENGLIDPLFGAEFVATVWKKNGQIIDLGTLGGRFSLPNSINDRGQAAGGAENTIPDPDNLGGSLIGLPSPTQWHAALWQNGTIQDLGTLGDGPVSFADFVNERGQVAGVSFTDSVPNPTTGIPTVDPFFWENGHMVDVGNLGGTFAFVCGLNNRGQIAGTSNLPGDQNGHPFLWERGSLTDLGTLGGSNGFANWIDDSGEVVGGSWTTDDQNYFAFRWKHGHMTNLGSLNGDPCSLAFSSNSKGQIVGNSTDCGDQSRAFLWENGGPMVDLNSLIPPNSGLLLKEGAFIGEGGEIAGKAVLDNGEEHAFLLIPEEQDGGDGMESATAATENDVAPAAESAATVVHSKLTPEMKTALRVRFANRHRGFGLRPPELPAISTPTLSQTPTAATPTRTPRPRERTRTPMPPKLTATPTPTQTPTPVAPTRTPRPPKPGHTPPPTATPTPAPGQVTIDAGGFFIGSFLFQPASITVHVGDTVTWVWVSPGGTSSHSTTSGTCPSSGPWCSADGKWDSGSHFGSFSFSHTFLEAGTFRYFDSAGYRSVCGNRPCIRHAQGVVVVH